MKNLLLPLLLSKVLFLASGQEYSFTAERLVPPNENTLFLRCEDTTGPVTSPTFFRGDEIVEPVFPSGDRHVFAITPALEGDYACGTVNEFGRTMSPFLTIVGEIFWLKLGI